MIVSSTTGRKFSGGLIERARREDQQKFDTYYSYRGVIEDEYFLGVSPRLWLNVSKNFEKSALLDPEDR